VIHRVFVLGPCSQPSNSQNRARKYTQDRSKHFAKLPFVAIANVKALYTELSHSSPHHGQFFRLLNLIIVGIPIVRRRDATPLTSPATILAPAKTSQADHCQAPCCLHQIPGWLYDRCSPAAAIRGKSLPRTADVKAPRPSELGITTALVLPLASLGHTATRAPLPSVPFLAEQAVPSSSSTTSRRSSEVDRKKNSSQAATHDSVFGRVRVFLLDLDRDVSLYHRQNLSAISCSCAPSSAASS
jgi:hypothetical protein